ncbi:predicted protein [Pyrenophora tritici-repentis Pt-1C-BFP]|uniref:Uncharacterized protein n=1 Tax=Pyrenophora tritici-repentis (strain Pt-1C-BFP) TaxID=426418 RepID=B2W3W3_PYRTR|nr:uncharacterized protein PTRG_05163 [Pyrenophora tritici-repentis Pt-1C-BFP]EDU48070.1 predicted protein [Pyrenophora tritici-repentis Pt-1C-BFP]
MHRFTDTNIQATEELANFGPKSCSARVTAMCFVHNYVAEAQQATLDKIQRGTAAPSASYVMGSTGMPPRHEPLDGRGGLPSEIRARGKREGGHYHACDDRNEQRWQVDTRASGGSQYYHRPGRVSTVILCIL